MQCENSLYVCSGRFNFISESLPGADRRGEILSIKRPASLRSHRHQLSFSQGFEDMNSHVLILLKLVHKLQKPIQIIPILLLSTFRPFSLPKVLCNSLLFIFLFIHNSECFLLSFFNFIFLVNSVLTMFYNHVTVTIGRCDDLAKPI
jgi:hypothetical protein